MRPEKIEKVKSVAYVIGNIVSQFEDINSENQLRIDTELKHQERRAEEEIRRIQKENNLKEDGYYISAGIVYKVYHTNTMVKKITGDEAKRIKRLTKLTLQERVTEQIEKAISQDVQEGALDERFALQA